MCNDNLFEPMSYQRYYTGKKPKRVLENPIHDRFCVLDGWTRTEVASLIKDEPNTIKWVIPYYLEDLVKQKKILSQVKNYALDDVNSYGGCDFFYIINPDIKPDLSCCYIEKSTPSILNVPS